MTHAPQSWFFLLVALPLASLSAACGSDGDATPSDAPDAAADSPDESAFLDTASSTDAKDDAPLPLMLTVRLRATDAQFNHVDGLSGLTPLSASGGIRSLSLLRDQNDIHPAVLFDSGQTATEASFSDGGDTLVGAIPIGDVPPGKYTIARMVQAFSRYSIPATMHDASASTPGELHNLVVMSDSTLVDGGLRDAGYYHYEFTAAGQQPTTFEGDDAIVPAYSTTAGAFAVVEGGQWAVYFPVNLDWSSGLSSPLELVITVNMFESFRWTDVVAPGYLPGVFDFTAVSYEPVVRFGGNEFVSTVE